MNTMIEQLTGFDDDIAAFACHGHVTKEDYATVLVPDVEKRLQQHEKIRLYYEVGADFDGVAPGAMWEDTKVGFGHLTRWDRLAVVTDVDWMKHTIKAFGFLMPAELRVFSSAEADEARTWIAQRDTDVN